MEDSSDDNSGLLTNIWNAISSIPDKIKELTTAIGDFFTFCFDVLSEIPTVIGNILDVLNPFSDNFFLKDFFATLFDILNPFSENFILKQVIDGIGSIFTWLGNFFFDLLEFVYHIFIPTDEQWDAIKEDYQDLGDTFSNHLPFVGLFSDELENAKQIVYNEDFLNIKFDSWSFDLGVVQFSTPEINFTGVLNAYEPYRMTIRTLLTFVVVCLTLVYIIKYFLKYGETGGNTNVIDNGNGGGNK